MAWIFYNHATPSAFVSPPSLSFPNASIGNPDTGMLGLGLVISDWANPCSLCEARRADMIRIRPDYPVRYGPFRDGHMQIEWGPWCGHGMPACPNRGSQSGRDRDRRGEGMWVSSNLGATCNAISSLLSKAKSASWIPLMGRIQRAEQSLVLEEAASSCRAILQNRSHGPGFGPTGENAKQIATAFSPCGKTPNSTPSLPLLFAKEKGDGLQLLCLPRRKEKHFRPIGKPFPDSLTFVFQRLALGEELV